MFTLLRRIYRLDGFTVDALGACLGFRPLDENHHHTKTRSPGTRRNSVRHSPTDNWQLATGNWRAGKAHGGEVPGVEK